MCETHVRLWQVVGVQESKPPDGASARTAIMFRGDIVEMGPVKQVLMDPQHPYTQLLRESIPEADSDKRWDKRVTLADTEHEEYLRQGCGFSGRCPQVMEVCRGTVPPDLQIGSALVGCHLYNGNEDNQE